MLQVYVQVGICYKSVLSIPNVILLKNKYFYFARSFIVCFLVSDVINSRWLRWISRSFKDKWWANLLLIKQIVYFPGVHYFVYPLCIFRMYFDTHRSVIFSIYICVHNFKENPFLCLAVVNEYRNFRDNSFVQEAKSLPLLLAKRPRICESLNEFKRWPRRYPWNGEEQHYADCSG